MFCKNTLQTQLSFVVICLIAVVTVGCAAKKELWGDPEKGLILAYRFPENQALKYEMSSENIQKMEVMGQPIEIKSDKTYVFSVESKELKEDNYKLGITIDSMKSHVVTPQGELSPDMSNVIGKSFDMALSPLGKEVDLSGSESIQWELAGEKHSITPDFQTIFPDLADRPVKIGDSWESKDTISIKEASSEVRISLEGMNTLVGYETMNGVECARITTEFTGTVDGKGKQQGIDLVTEGEVKGTDTWYFGYKDGLLVKLISSGVAEAMITGSGPQNITIPMTQEIKVETTLAR